MHAVYNIKHIALLYTDTDKHTLYRTDPSMHQIAAAVAAAWPDANVAQATAPPCAPHEGKGARAQSRDQSRNHQHQLLKYTAPMLCVYASLLLTYGAHHRHTQQQQPETATPHRTAPKHIESGRQPHRARYRHKYRT